MSKTQTELSFKDSNKKLNEISVPVVMSDFNRLDELKKFQGKFEEEGEVFKEQEIADYIGILNEFYYTFNERIGNNLNQTKYKDSTKLILSKLIDKIVVIGDSTEDNPKYNCHGWSLGQVKWYDLNVSQDSFITQINIDKKIGLITNTIYDSTQKNFFSIKSSSLLQKEYPSQKDGGIVAYYGDDNKLTHTSRYVTYIDWYKYDDKIHTEWYSKKQKLIEFDEKGNCFINNYTSKLGLGYNVVHEVEDLVPLYGETLQYYDLDFE